MEKAFDGFVWKDYADIDTPLSARILNKINGGLDEVDRRVVVHNTTKFDTSEAQLLVKDVSLNEESGVLTVLYYNGSTVTYSSLLGKLAVNFDFNEETQKLMIYLSNGERKEVDLSSFIAEYEFVDTETVNFRVSGAGKVSAIIKEGSIQEKHLRPDYLADIRMESSNAQTSATRAEESKTEAAALASVAREKAGEASASAENAAESAAVAAQKSTEANASAINAADSETNAGKSAAAASGKAMEASSSAEDAANSASVASEKASAALESEMNSAESENNADAYANKSKSYSVGGTGTRPGEDLDNAKYYYQQSKIIYDDFSESGEVMGVKGSAEESYRTGLVSISSQDIGLGNVNNTADKDKSVASAVHLGMPRTPESPSDLSDLAKYPNGSLTAKEFAPVADVIPDLPSEAYYHTLIGQSADPAYATQLALGMTAEKIAYRMKYAGGWRPWREIVHTGNVGQQSVKRASVASGIQSLQTDGVTEYPEGSYLIRSMFNGTGFKLVCKNNNSDAATYGVIVDRADKAVLDGSGNVISNTYAKKSVYGDEFINLGGGLGERGKFSLSCGSSALASGWCAQAEGSGTYAPGECSHAEGRETTATNYASHVCGKHNKAMTAGGSEQDQIGDAFVIGNGRFGAKSNALRVTYLGDILGTKAFQSSGADYAEFIKPWADGNPEGEDRVGYFVTIKEGFLEKAGEGDYIVGITSGNPSVVGNADEDYYWRYERDEFNRIVMEDAPELAQEKDEAGNPLFDGETGAPVMVETGRTVKNARMKLAEGYDPSMQDAYAPRADRPEWDYVGMVGVVPVRDDGTCMPGRFCRCGGSGVATLAPERRPDCFFVLERISDCVVSVILR